MIGIISLVRSFIRPGTPVGSFTLKGLLLVIGATVLFGLIVRGAGLIIALPLLVIVSAYASKPVQLAVHRSPWPSGSPLFCILIFLKGLGIPLPILGSWFGR